MNKLKKIGVVIISALMMIAVFCGCNSNEETEQSTEYDYLKTDIVGFWIVEGGPEYVEQSSLWGVPAYIFYEYTSNGEVYEHDFSNNDGQIADISIKLSDYEFDGNMLIAYQKEDETVQRMGCYLEIKDDIMTMTTDSGESRYVRVSYEQAKKYNLVSKEEAYQQSLQQVAEAETAESGEAVESAEAEENAETVETTESSAE